ncbi:MAG: hypothetical protein E7477_06200 [Ruminococcaceae bacterium]|nr:hypothetical protein [Oscillospiraceae bacterium]
MKKVIIKSLCIAACLTIARSLYYLSHPEWSVAVWVPAISAFIGGFIASFAVLGTIELFERNRNKK